MAPDDVSRPAQSASSIAFGPLDIREIVRVLRRGMWVIAWSIAFFLALGATFIFSIVPQYTASAYVEINPRQAQILNFKDLMTGTTTDSTTIGTEIEILRSRNLAERAVQKLNLHSLPEFNDALAAPSIPKAIIGSIKGASSTVQEYLDKWLGLGKAGSGAKSATSEPVTSEFTDLPLLSYFRDRDNKHEEYAAVAEQERSNVVDTYLKRLNVVPLTRSRVIGIFFSSENPRTAATIVNTTADLYIVSQLEAKYETAKRANTWLSDRIAELRRDVDRAERSVETFRNKSGLTRGKGTATLVDDQLTDLNARYIQQRTLLGQALARQRQAEDLLKSPNGIETAAAVLNSQVIRDLLRDESLVQRTMVELSNEYGAKHPKMIATKAQQTDIRRKIRIEMEKIIQGLRNEVAVARGAAQQLKSELDASRVKVSALDSAQVQLRALERESNASRLLLEQLLSRSKELATQTDFQQPDATLITKAPIPDKPTYPKTGLMFILLLTLGTTVGIYGAFLADRVDHGYRSADELTRELGVVALGLIPAISQLKSRGKGPQDYCVENPTSAYAEALRSLHTNMLLADVGNRPGVVLVTSALPNEGKSSIVVSLARVLAGAGRAVVVVDCDLRRPTVHGLFGAKDGPGLVECVNGKASLDHVIQEDKQTSVHFIRAGERSTNSPDIFDSVAFQQLLKTLSRSYDMVLLDSPPVLAVSDTLFLARLANKTVLVVRWARTRRAMASLALKKLIDARANIAGVLLSRVDIEGHAQYGFSDSGTYSGAMKKYYTG
jgi:capsular exopolysaccharide synthesis family protein